MKTWERAQTREFAKNDFWEYRIDDFIIDGNIPGTYHYVHTPGSTMVIPVTDEKKILMIRQYRYLNRKFSLEFPCGGVKPGLSAEENAMKELQEEAGCRAGFLSQIGFFAPFTGAADEICHLFLGEKLSPAPLPPDFTEDFSIHHLTLDDIQKYIDDNEIWDGLTLAAWALAKNRLTELLA